MNKIYGRIKWYNSDKKYGYIIGYDEEKYFFKAGALDETLYKKNDLVLFIPNFATIPYAVAVELAS